MVFKRDIPKSGKCRENGILGGCAPQLHPGEEPEHFPAYPKFPQIGSITELELFPLPVTKALQEGLGG